MIIRLLVTGGRTFSNRLSLERTLDAVNRKHAIEVLIEGECPTGGADRLAREWAESRRVPVEPYPVNHTLDGPWPGAGPRRNARMLEFGRPTHCIAFEGGRGTADMVRRFNAYSGKRADAWQVRLPADSLEPVP